MTRDGRFKRQVRARMRATGESYVQALIALRPSHPRRSREEMVAGMVEVEVLGVRQADLPNEMAAELVEQFRRANPGAVADPEQFRRAPVVHLRVKDGERTLPIWCGAAEAAAISYAVEGKVSPRPTTHELAASFFRAFEGLRPLCAVITRLDSAGTYFAELRADDRGEAVAIDARPSDSIAIAVRLGVPVFVSDELASLDWW